ncbi:unnamed protein product [Spodoptera exigua]|nr:unnamed protein product [Spodoptera exigua]
MYSVTVTRSVCRIHGLIYGRASSVIKLRLHGEEKGGPREEAILLFTPQPPQLATLRALGIKERSSATVTRVCGRRVREPGPSVRCVAFRARLKEPIGHHRRGPIGLMFSWGCGVDNALVTPPTLRVSMGYADCFPSGNPFARPPTCHIKKILVTTSGSEGCLANGLPEVCVVAVYCKPATSEDDVLSNVVGVVKSCAEEDVWMCIKERSMRFLENAASARELKLADGLAIYNVGTSRSARSYEPLPEEPQARENQVEARLVDAAADFMENHVIQLRMPKSTVEDMKRSLEEGRGKKKKLKQLLPILALLQLKIQSLIPLFLGIIAFAAIKGLMLAKAALLASALVLLKKLLSKSEHHESYEVVAHPHHEEHFSHGGGGHGGWGRSSQDAQSLAYNAYSN